MGFARVTLSRRCGRGWSRGEAGTMSRPSFKLTPAALLGTFVCLGLAVHGWGGLRAFFAEPARLVLAIIMVAFTVAAQFSGGNVSPGEREDRGNRWVLA